MGREVGIVELRWLRYGCSETVRNLLWVTHMVDHRCHHLLLGVSHVLSYIHLMRHLRNHLRLLWVAHRIALVEHLLRLSNRCHLLHHLLWVIPSRVLWYLLHHIGLMMVHNQGYLQTMIKSFLLFLDSFLVDLDTVHDSHDPGDDGTDDWDKDSKDYLSYTYNDTLFSLLCETGMHETSDWHEEDVKKQASQCLTRSKSHL